VCHLATAVAELHHEQSRQSLAASISPRNEVNLTSILGSLGSCEGCKVRHQNIVEERLDLAEGG
jgi:hypothetical protein